MIIIHIVDGIVEFLKRIENSEIRHVCSFGKTPLRPFFRGENENGFKAINYRDVELLLKTLLKEIL